jgi:ribosomal protein L14E/L6E/L27E
MKEIMVKIVKCYPVAKRGQYRVVDTVVEEISTKKQYKVGVFLEEQDWSFSEGDIVVMTVKEGKPYKGVVQYSCNLNSISLSDTPKPSIKKAFDEEMKKVVKPKEKQKEKELIDEVTKEQDMWNKKERREHKRALTMHAFGLFVPRSNEDGTPLMDRWTAIRDMRDIMLEDLYND